MESDAVKKQAEDLVAFLRARVMDEMSLEVIIRFFEEMAAIPVNGVAEVDDLILFETGTYSFQDESVFYFSLVRQIPNEDEEFYQVHLKVVYPPTSASEELAETVWNEDLTGSIFDYILNSEAFTRCQSQEYVRTEIFLDET